MNTPTTEDIKVIKEALGLAYTHLFNLEMDTLHNPEITKELNRQTMTAVCNALGRIEELDKPPLTIMAALAHEYLELVDAIELDE